ncbi:MULTISPECIES: hypothetical protein [unclassified Caballeronia]|uniref:hypothetical protein n=1 Tax=unclassified Caballeronia TaxID=2646786 RepID=UPI002864D9F8|nr:MULTISPECIES: hypothetical protein [unclassified Caballeronia]MDR5753492.1 hypothetical protein [Caballeronia sp. LZ024]MDR5839871.1 hypothetical protein [Caballeronia sp. LZ031]
MRGIATQTAPHDRPQVCSACAENWSMEQDEDLPLGRMHPLRGEAFALALSIETIRRARGRSNPRDFALGSPQWEKVSLDFARDIRWALGMNDEDDDESQQ